MKMDFMFKGMMVPVFTPFYDDKKHTINYDVIDKYGQYLKSMGMAGVMINGMTGEGLTLTLEERMKLTEKWMEVTRKYEMKLFVHIGGLPLPEIYELAIHAEKLKVDAVLLMPDVYYKPKTEVDLMVYLKDIISYMPTRPFLYYHIPMMTELYLDWYNFMLLVEKELPTFVGYFWAEDRMEKVMFLKEKFPEYLYIIGTGVSMLGYMAEGFDAISMVSMNLFPEMMKELYDLMLNYKLHDAYLLKVKMIKRIYSIFHMDKHSDWLMQMKVEMDKLHPFKVGPVRKPVLSEMLW